jgi:hypothetical protein
MPKVCSVTSNRIRFSTTISVPQLDSAENTQVGESSELIAVLPEKKKRRRASHSNPRPQMRWKSSANREVGQGCRQSQVRAE